MVDATYRGSPQPGNADLWRGLRAKEGYSFLDTWYETTDADLRGGLTTMSFGMVTLGKKHKMDLSYPYDNAYLYGGWSGGDGIELVDGAAKTGGRYCAIATSPLRYLDPLDSSDTAHNSAYHHNISGAVDHTAVGYEEAGDYARDGFFNHNGRTHVGAGITPWRTNGVTTGVNPKIGRAQGNLYPFPGTFIGWWMHTEYLTDDELFLLQQEIALAHDIPEIPRLGGPVLDHIWTFRDMSLGDPAATFTSKGAIGGKTFSLAGGYASNLEVYGFRAQFSPR